MFERAATVVEQAGDDPQARLEAVVRTIGWWMLENELPFRRLAKSALERWFDQAGTPDSERVPVREGRRNRQSRLVVEPLVGRLDDHDVERLQAALGIILGTDSMLALRDGVGLDVDEAKVVMVDAARWMMAGALAELDPHDR